MRKNMPYMVLDITKKPGDPNAVKTGDMLLAENTKLREALKKCLLYIACAESVGIGTITLNDKVKLDPKKIIKSAKAALAAPPRNCDEYTANELKVKFNSELVSELPIANEHEKNLVTITAMGVIDTLFATTQEGGAK